MEIKQISAAGFTLSSKKADVGLGEYGAKVDVQLSPTAGESTSEGISFASPGEYEVKNCMIDGVALAPDQTAYRVELDGMSVAFFGTGSIDNGLSDEQVERIDGVDILILPVSGDKAEVTNKIITQLEPKIVIPYGYTQEQLKILSAEFGREPQKVDKFKIIAKDLSEDHQELVVLDN